MRKYSGRRGAAKTACAVLDFLDQCLEGKKWCVGAFPHPEWAERLVSELYAQLGPKEFVRRVRVEYVGDMSKVIMRRFIQHSESQDPWVQKQEDEEFKGVWIDMVERYRNIPSLIERPVLYKGTHIGVTLAQDLDRNQEAFFSQGLLPYVFSRNNPERAYRAMHCTNGEIRAELDRIGRMGPHDELNLAEPVKRLFEGIVGVSAMLARTSKKPTFDWVKFLNDAGIYIIIGGADDALGMFIGCDFAEKVFLSKSRRVWREGVYLQDEVNNYKLFGRFESKCLSTMRAFMGEDSIWHIVQSNDYPDEDMLDNVDQNCVQYIFQQGSFKMADHCSKLLLAATDRMKVHHTDTRTKQVHAGLEERKTHSVGKKHDPHKISHVTDHRTNTTLVAKYAEVEEKIHHYEGGQDQLLWQAQALMQLPVGTCWVRPMNGKPYLRKVDWFPDSWVFPGDPERGVPPLWKTKLKEALALLKTLPEYEAPVMLPVPVPEPEKPKEQPRRRGPTATETLRRKGTPNSGNSSRKTR